MIVISSEDGFCLMFKSDKDLENVIEDLKGQLEWVRKNRTKPPYLYMTYDIKSKGNEKIEKVAKFMKDLKENLSRNI